MKAFVDTGTNYKTRNPVSYQDTPSRGSHYRPVPLTLQLAGLTCNARLTRKYAIILPSPAGREASSGGSAPPHVRHRPERTLLYQLVEWYQP